jgi:hypothetical protein
MLSLQAEWVFIFLKLSSLHSLPFHVMGIFVLEEAREKVQRAPLFDD